MGLFHCRRVRLGRGGDRVLVTVAQLVQWDLVLLNPPSVFISADAGEVGGTKIAKVA
jgi:hypothetical protein